MPLIDSLFPWLFSACSTSRVPSDDGAYPPDCDRTEKSSTTVFYNVENTLRFTYSFRHFQHRFIFEGSDPQRSQVTELQNTREPFYIDTMMLQDIQRIHLEINGLKLKDMDDPLCPATPRSLCRRTVNLATMNVKNAPDLMLLAFRLSFFIQASTGLNLLAHSKRFCHLHQSRLGLKKEQMLLRSIQPYKLEVHSQNEGLVVTCNAKYQVLDMDNCDKHYAIVCSEVHHNVMENRSNYHISIQDGDPL